MDELGLVKSPLEGSTPTSPGVPQAHPTRSSGLQATCWSLSPYSSASWPCEDADDETATDANGSKGFPKSDAQAPSGPPTTALTFQNWAQMEHVCVLEPDPSEGSRIYWVSFEEFGPDAGGKAGSHRTRAVQVEIHRPDPIVPGNKTPGLLASVLGREGVLWFCYVGIREVGATQLFQTRPPQVLRPSQQVKE